MRLAPLVALLLAAPLAAQVPSPEQQIAGAVSAAPESARPGATVHGWTNYHRPTVLRQGTGDMVCLADDPADTQWHVACYHKDLEPFMSRGRELTQAGRSRGEIDSIRLAEIQAGTLKFPDGPRALYNLYAPADSVDQTTGLPRNPGRLDIVYLPYATPESTGLPARPQEGRTWLMYPGKPWAHVMIMR